MDRFMPMHCMLDNGFKLIHLGPTLHKILNEDSAVGSSFFDHFELRNPQLFMQSAKGEADGEQSLRVNLCNGNAKRLNAIAHKLPMEQGYLVNFSLGVNAIHIIENLNLVATDFAPTDPSIDMIYLIEVQQALLRESRKVAIEMNKDRKEAYAKADRDPLTGLHNRRALHAFVNRIMRRQKFIPFALVLIDLDRFKSINDTLGHAAGDRVLKIVSEKLGLLTRPSDLVVRAGGDEFVLLLGDFSDVKAVKRLSHRIIEELEKPINFQGEKCRISASIGIRIIDSPCDFDEAYNSTDQAMYDSKKSGGGQVTIHNED